MSALVPSSIDRDETYSISWPCSASSSREAKNTHMPIRSSIDADIIRARVTPPVLNFQDGKAMMCYWYARGVNPAMGFDNKALHLHGSVVLDKLDEFINVKLARAFQECEVEAECHFADVCLVHDVGDN